ncbi:MAG: gliding motility-associated C-terminal domain-containing protein [Bacteroidia bacterium]
MKFLQKIVFISFLIAGNILLFGINAFGTHNRAGEITFERVGDPTDYEYEITLTTYTEVRSPAAHRDEVQLFFGYGPPDNEANQIVQCVANECQRIVAPNTWQNVYRVRHQFPGPGTCYTIHFTDPNRVDAILNINDSFSVNIPFYVESQLCIYDDLGITSNNSPELLELPISYACLGKRYEHNPNAYDKDGDSLAYSFTIPKMGNNREVTNYSSPGDVPGNENSLFSLDPITGDLIWDSPKRPGIYNIAIKISEYRRVITSDGSSFYRQIGYIIRDMQIFVIKCNNDPPDIVPINDTCIVAGGGNTLIIDVVATDPDPQSIITLKATGGPFELRNNRALFNEGSGNPVTRKFRWEVNCDHIRQQPYSVVFNATDNGNGFQETQLTAIEQVNIKVIGPAPRNITTEPIGNGVEIKWGAPQCDGVINYFIYQKVNESNWSPDNCETGVPAVAGYKRIAIVDANTFSFYHNRNGKGLFHGTSYCYRVTALYKPSGQFAQVEGIASEESCSELKQEIPILTKASVLNTNNGGGQVEINWASPIELDTIQYKPYYRFVLKQSPDLGGDDFTVLLDRQFNTFKELKLDTIHISSGLSTRATPYSYQIDFYHFNEITQQEELFGSAKSASTPWLKLNPAYKSLIIEIETDVPWKNDSFAFYRQNRSSLDFEYIGSSYDGTFKDSGLINGATYCYRAETYGSFRDSGIIDTVQNWSQERCGIPKDTVPPCAPIVEAIADCDMYQNSLTWTFPDNNCAFDVVKYYIYFQERGVGSYALIDSLIGGPDETGKVDSRAILKNNLAGCYRVIAVDSFNNWSDSSNEACVDNCPIYSLPNIFSPNGDGENDSLKPIPDYRFIDSVNVLIYNRWGQEVYQSNEVNFKWDGTNLRNGRDLNTGTYFYVVTVQYIRLRENEERTITGSIQIVR